MNTDFPINTHVKITMDRGGIILLGTVSGGKTPDGRIPVTITRVVKNTTGATIPKDVKAPIRSLAKV